MKGLVLNEVDIKNKILNIRGVAVMLDSDLAKLYGVVTKRLNEQVRRNIGRFPPQFMFQLNEIEFNNLRSQIATSSMHGGKRYLPYVFTEQGVAMLAGILNSKIAINVSIQIMDAFVNMRKYLQSNRLILHRLDNVEKKQLVYDTKLDEVFNLLENNSIEKKEGIFYDGQVFDAYVFVCDLIKSARNQIILIDNYVDESIFEIFIKTNVRVVIFTKKYVKLDFDKLKEQYKNIEVKNIEDFHDRFLIIDDNIYHFGASLKDLGKKLFAFSKFEKEGFRILEKIEI